MERIFSIKTKISSWSPRLWFRSKIVQFLTENGSFDKILSKRKIYNRIKEARKKENSKNKPF